MNPTPHKPHVTKMKKVLINKVAAGINEDYCVDLRSQYQIYRETLDEIILQVSEQDAKYLQAQFGALAEMNE